MLSVEPLRSFNVLVASTGTVFQESAQEAISRLQRLSNVSIRVIRPWHDYKSDKTSNKDFISFGVQPGDRSRCSAPLNTGEAQVAATELCRWADLLILLPIDADNLAKMLQGMTDNLMLAVLRSWNVAKRILLVPGMSTLMWENPMTKKQLSKVRRKWKWIRVLPVLLWNVDPSKNTPSEAMKPEQWEGMDELMAAVQNQVDLATIGHDVDLTLGQASTLPKPIRKNARTLPPEIWSMVLEQTGDWELAQALNIYTTLPTPPEWQPHQSPDRPQTPMETLEWTILTGTLTDVQTLLTTSPPPRWLSRLSIKLIMRFANTALLTYLEHSHPSLFWSAFGHTFLPDKASSVFGKPELLEYWRTSPSFLTKEYTAEALDGASRAGFVHVLEWWHRSGLPLRYTEAALEQASARGRIEVLDWWKNAASVSGAGGGGGHDADEGEEPYMASLRPQPLRLKPGKSVSYATQAGQLETLRWWATSEVPFSHEDTVAKLASTHGHVALLEYWKGVRGEKMVFDNQVLVGATKMGQRDVLEWWKRSGLRVEYKTCDIEEALEDGVEGVQGEEVRRWWARNGLNLGVGTSEWMRTKMLN